MKRPQVLLKTIKHGEIDAHPACAAVLEINKEDILNEFLKEIRKALPAAKGKSKSALEDHLPEMIDTMINVLEAETHVKAHEVTEVAQEHGVQRTELKGFTLDQVIHEYGILQRVILKSLHDNSCFDFTAVRVVQEIIQRGCEEAAREFLANSEEITETATRKHADAIAESESRYRSILTSLTDAIIVMDRKTLRALEANPGAERLFGVKEADMKKRGESDASWKAVLPDGTPVTTDNDPITKAVKEGREEHNIEMGFEVKGERRWVLMNTVPVYHANSNVPFAGVVSIHDITERKAHEQELRQTIEKLRAEREIREKFVSTLTHDLRTPLAAAKMSAQLILRKNEDRGVVQQLATRIADNIVRTDNMIQDLLDATRIQAGFPLRLEIMPMNLHDLVEDTLNDLTTIHGNRFDFRFTGDVTGNWCPRSLRRVIENLCTNAIKYGDQHAPITVRLEGHKKDALLAIHNKGTPLSAADKARLFEQFSRTSAAEQSDRPGWGIGLTIVKGIVEAHNGTIEVLDINDGTEFQITLPRT